MQQELFRKEAMDRLSSPEQLDKLIKVTNPRYWIILVAAGILIFFAILWGITGEVMVRESVSGALVSSGGIHQIISQTSGELTDIRVKPGDFVKKGDIIARVDQSELVNEIKSLERNPNQAGGDPAVSVKEQLATLRERLNYESVIISAEEGRVVSVQSEVGTNLVVGTPVMTISVGGSTVKQLVAVMYVPVSRGKALKPGMKVNVYPTVAKKEEYGYMMGTVSSVSKYPVSKQDIQNMVGSEQLAAQFTANSAVLEVYVDLVPSETTISGYKWSTAGGVPVRLESGTICTGDVILGESKPLTMVVPVLGKLLDN